MTARRSDAIDGTVVELRYSAPPAAPLGGRIWNAGVGSMVEVWNSDGAYSRATLQRGQTKYTPMVDDRNNLAWACYTNPGRNYSKCTAQF